MVVCSADDSERAARSSHRMDPSTSPLSSWARAESSSAAIGADAEAGAGRRSGGISEFAEEFILVLSPVWCARVTRLVVKASGELPESGMLPQRNIGHVGSVASLQPAWRVNLAWECPRSQLSGLNADACAGDRPKPGVGLAISVLAPGTRPCAQQQSTNADQPASKNHILVRRRRRPLRRGRSACRRRSAR
jgi:hypothetical protein